MDPRTTVDAPVKRRGGVRLEPAPTEGARPPAGAQWLPALDVLRGVAAAAVVVHHSYSLAGSRAIPGATIFAGLGQWGVDLFFVLSGFLLAEYWWRPPEQRSVRVFYIRRFFRIVPAYYAMLLVLFLFFIDHALVFSRVGAEQVLANTTLAHWLFPATSPSLFANGALWTLTIEVILYLLLPVLALVVARSPLWGSLSLLALGVGYRWLASVPDGWLVTAYFGNLESPPPWVQHIFVVRQFLGILPVFVIGITLRWLLIRGPWRGWTDRPVVRPSVLLIGALLLPSLLVITQVARGSDYLDQGWFVAYDVLLGLAFVPVLLYAARPVLAGTTRPLYRFGQWLGTRSYSIYLWHFPIILAVYGMGAGERAAQLEPLVPKLVLVAVLVLVVGTASYETVERWGLRVGRDLSRRSTPPPVAEAAAEDEGRHPGAVTPGRPGRDASLS